MSQIEPPRIGPSTGATRVVIAHSAMAAGARSLGKMRSSRVWDSGISGAAGQALHDAAEHQHFQRRARGRTSAEKTPNSIMAVVKTRTAPNRAASQPVSGTVIASATE